MGLQLWQPCSLPVFAFRVLLLVLSDDIGPLGLVLHQVLSLKKGTYRVSPYRCKIVKGCCRKVVGLRTWTFYQNMFLQDGLFVWKNHNFDWASFQTTVLSQRS